MRNTLCAALAVILISCGHRPETDLRIRQIDPTEAARMARDVESRVKPQLADGLAIKLWGIDSLVVSPLAIDLDDKGRLYYTTTNRQKNSEFDIRSHKDWEIASISLQTVEERRSFLRKELSPENSIRNQWLADLNGDGSHDWKDLTVETERVYLLEDLSGDGVADRSQLVIDDFHTEVTDVAGGVLSYEDDLYLSVAPDLWRIRDKNKDGIADEKTALSQGYGVHVGFGGHGMSGLEMGPDGRLYWQIGDIGFSGTGPDGRRWEHPNSGVIARANPDGSDFEIFAHGLRNTHEFAFDVYGNLISEDNDGDHAGEKERLVYIVDGSDAGWRSNWQYGKYNDPENNRYNVWMDEKMYLPRFDGQAAYITPCIANFVSGPAGMVYNPGTAIGREFVNTFFVAEFVGNASGSGIHSFRLNNKGAGFELGDHRKILSGVLPTGLDFGPDGALYLGDWIEGWGTNTYGRIWKLDQIDTSSAIIRREVQRLIGENFTKLNDQSLGELLKHPDMRIRQKAQFELVKRKQKGARVFEAQLEAEAPQLARIHSIWGISQLARQNSKYAGLLVPLLKDRDPEIRAQAAKWLGDIKYHQAGNALIAQLTDTNARARFFAAEALGRIQYKEAVPNIIKLLETNNDEDAYIRHAGTLAMARIGEAAPVLALSSHPSKALRIAAVVTLRRMAHPGISAFLVDQDEFIATEAARAINDDNSIPDALTALANLLNRTPFRNEALLRRAINACIRLRTPDGLRQLARFARVTQNDPKMRAEALAAMSGWGKPSVLDRVDGRHRELPERNPALVVDEFAGLLDELLHDEHSVVRLNAVKAIRKLDVRSASAQLMATIKVDSDEKVKMAALETLVEFGDALSGSAVQIALADRNVNLRIAALGMLENIRLPENVIETLLQTVIETKTTQEKQAALLTIGRLKTPAAEGILQDLLNQMRVGKLDAGILLELGEAVDSSGSQPLIDRYKSISEKLSPGDIHAAYAFSLKGGDVGRGREVFFSNQQAQCMKCHSYDDRGGNAGPRLNGVADRLSREQLLEALISPDSRLAPGFGMATVKLKNGETITGVFHGEDAAGMHLQIGTQPMKMILIKDISEKVFSPSSMPDMKTVLSKKEIRDLVSFLATLKGE